MRQQTGAVPKSLREKRHRHRQLRERYVGKPKPDPKFKRDLQRLLHGLDKAIARFGDLDIATFIALALQCSEFRKTPQQTAWMWKTVMGRYLGHKANEFVDRLLAKKLQSHRTLRSRPPHQK